MAAKKAAKKAAKRGAAGRYVVVRTYSAGVHVGYLVSEQGERVQLRDASRIWRWRGANTLHELALRGPDRAAYTRISERVPAITLTESIEVIDAVASEDCFAPVWLP